MPRAGHRGGLFPVSGLPWGYNATYRYRGLYHTHRSDLLTPRWGYRYQKGHESILPDDSNRMFEPDTKFAWPIQDFHRHSVTYAQNELRYLQPACLAKNPKIKQYILNVLEPSFESTFSGIGLPNVCVNTPHISDYNYNQKEAQENIKSIYKELDIFPQNIYNVSKGLRKSSKNDNSDDLAQNCFDVMPQLERGKIKKLYNLVCESDIWRNYDSYTHSKKHKKNIFPYIDESAAIIRDLPLSEVLYSRSNHRVKVRRHPIWICKLYRDKKITLPYKHRLRVAQQEAQQKELGLWRETYLE